MDIRTAEGVNGLFGVTDHQEGGLGPATVDSVESGILNGVRVLEFVNHGHRELIRHELRQVFVSGALQCVV